MPLQVIITAAKTVSRASDAVFGPPESISVTISATSITVTATASTSEPKGSPTRWATTSAWCTADSTAAARTRATSATGSGPRDRPQVSTSARTATTGATVDQAGTKGRLVAAMPKPSQTATGRRSSAPGRRTGAGGAMDARAPGGSAGEEA